MRGPWRRSKGTSGRATQKAAGKFAWVNPIRDSPSSTSNSFQLTPHSQHCQDNYALINIVASLVPFCESHIRIPILTVNPLCPPRRHGRNSCLTALRHVSTPKPSNPTFNSSRPDILCLQHKLAIYFSDRLKRTMPLSIHASLAMSRLCLAWNW